MIKLRERKLGRETGKERRQKGREREREERERERRKRRKRGRERESEREEEERDLHSSATWKYTLPTSAGQTVAGIVPR